MFCACEEDHLLCVSVRGAWCVVLPFVTTITKRAAGGRMLVNSDFSGGT